MSPPPGEICFREFAASQPRLRKGAWFVAGDRGPAGGGRLHWRRGATACDRPVTRSQWLLLEQCDGRTTVREALRRLATHRPADALTYAEAAVLFRQLEQAGALESGGPWSDAWPLLAAARPPGGNAVGRRERASWLTAWVVRHCKWGAHRCGWLFSPLALVAGAAFMAGALPALAAEPTFQHFAREALLSPSAWIAMLAIWWLAHPLPALARGVVATHWGGDVREASLYWWAGAPWLHVEISLPHRASQRRRRIAATLTSAYVLCCLAALAAVWASRSPPGALQSLLLLTTLTLGGGAILFLANPFAGLDGAELCGELLGAPNWADYSAEYTRYWLRRFVLRRPGVAPLWRSPLGALLVTFGVAAAMWRWLVVGCCAALAMLAGGPLGASLFVLVVGLASLLADLERRWRLRRTLGAV